jgi:YgiT-type zinc finger domain-containing protein
MKCVICKAGETAEGTATVTLERSGMTLVVKDVPAKVCDNCGEEYIEDAVSDRLIQQAEVAAGAGVQVDIRKFVA